MFFSAIPRLVHEISKFDECIYYLRELDGKHKLNEKVPSIVLMHVCPGAVTVVSKTVLFFFEPSVATENLN